MRRRTIGSKELYFNLNEHVKRNVLQLGSKFYLQNSGIPQGSVLSSLLCSFYYGHMDRNVIFPFLEKTCGPATEYVSGKDNCHDVSAAPSSSENNVITSSPKYMLLRFIDDFLFLSTSKQQAASFFSRLQRGFRDYNCYMNEGKFGMNFDIGHISRLSSNRIYVGEDGISFLRWSGLLINCCSLEVQADYTRLYSFMVLINYAATLGDRCIFPSLMFCFFTVVFLVDNPSTFVVILRILLLVQIILTKLFNF